MSRLFALAAFLCAGLASAQSGPQTPATIPTDPNQLMFLAAQMNGLGGINKPWHVKASYQTFDADGRPKDQGVFEEWWAGPRKGKISFAGKEFSRVEYYDGTKDLFTGDKGWVPLPQEMVMDYLVHPLPWSGRNQKESSRSANHQWPEGIAASSLQCRQDISTSPIC